MKKSEQFNNLYNVIEKLVNYLRKYPFIFIEIMENIFNNEYITFHKDTTIIINVYKIEKSLTHDFARFIKYLKNEKAFVKCIYQKEFLILHLESDIVKDLFVCNDMWRLMISIYYLKLCDIKNININKQDITVINFYTNNKKRVVCLNNSCYNNKSNLIIYDMDGKFEFMKISLDHLDNINQIYSVVA